MHHVSAGLHWHTPCPPHFGDSIQRLCGGFIDVITLPIRSAAGPAELRNHAGSGTNNQTSNERIPDETFSADQFKAAFRTGIVVDRRSRLRLHRPVSDAHRCGLCVRRNCRGNANGRPRRTGTGHEQERCRRLPRPNHKGTVAFVGTHAQYGKGVYKIDNGQVIRVASTYQPYPTPSFSDFGHMPKPGGKSFTKGNVSISNSGFVAFLARLSGGSLAIYVGWNQSNLSEIVKVGDTVDGYTVRDLRLSRESINDNGQVAFWADRQAGGAGVYRAQWEQLNFKAPPKRTWTEGFDKADDDRRIIFQKVDD